MSVFLRLPRPNKPFLRRITTHTGTAIGKYKPQDATTNPSLILAATKKAEYAALLDAAIAQVKDDEGGSIDQKVESALDHLLVQFGKKILEIIPGKVSTEVDAAFSFDTKASVDKALHIIDVCHPLIRAIYAANS
jgi:transaldolase